MRGYDGLRGRASNRKMLEGVKRRVVELFQKKQQTKLWHDYGPTLAAKQRLLDSRRRLSEAYAQLRN